MFRFVISVIATYDACVCWFGLYIGHYMYSSINNYIFVKLYASGCSGQRGLLSLFVQRTVLLGKGVGAAFTAIL